jgi:hypothetical protein
MDNLAAVTIPLTPEQSAEITQTIRSQEAARFERIFASVARNDDDPPLFDLHLILQF